MCTLHQNECNLFIIQQMLMFSHHQTAQEPSLFVSFASDKMHFMASATPRTRRPMSIVNCHPLHSAKRYFKLISFHSVQSLCVMAAYACAFAATQFTMRLRSPLFICHILQVSSCLWHCDVRKRDLSGVTKHTTEMQTHAHIRSNCLPLLICCIIYFSIFIYLFVLCAFHI